MTFENPSLVLSNIALFKGFSATTIEELLNCAERRNIATGEFVVLADQLAGGLFVIISGTIDVLLTLPGGSQQQKIATLGSGDSIGELALVGVTRRSASVKAQTPVEVVFWSTENFLNFMQIHHEVGLDFFRNLSTVLARRLVTTDKHLSNALYQNLYHFGQA